MTKLSSVQDPLTGSNYGKGINTTSSGVNASYQEYLNNLMETVQRPVSGPLQTQQQYTPSGGKSPVIGQISTPSLGSTPIFGSGAAVFPMAVLDRFKKAKHDAELEYLEQIGDVSMDTFKMDATLKNPWHNQAFNNKYQSSLDAWLDASASKFGGDYMKGMQALKMDKDFYSMAKSYEDYANIYNAVYDNAVDILSTNPEDSYVSPTSRQAARSFINDYENLDNLPIDQLVSRARKFQKYTSVNKIADGAMSNIGDRTYEDYKESTEMTTDEMNAWIKTTTKGASQKELKEIYNAQLEAYPWIKEDEVAKELLWTEIKTRNDKSHEEVVTQIKKDRADETSYLRKNGIKVAQDGSIQMVDDMTTMFTPYERGLMGRAKDGFVYPKKTPAGQDPIVNPPPGTIAKIMVPGKDGDMQMYTAAIPGTFTMTPIKEYTTSGGAVSGSGRYVEGTIQITDEGLYARELTGTPKDDGTTGQAQATGGTTPAQVQKQPVTIKDIHTGNTVQLYGDYTVAIPFNSVGDELGTAYPFLQRMHNDIATTTPSGEFVVDPGQTATGKEVDVAKATLPVKESGRQRRGRNKNTTGPIEVSTSNAGDAQKIFDADPGTEFLVDGELKVWDGTNLNSK